MRIYRAPILRALSAMALNLQHDGSQILICSFVKEPRLFYQCNPEQKNLLGGAGAAEGKHYPLGEAAGSLVRSARTPRATWKGHFQAPLGRSGQPAAPPQRHRLREGASPQSAEDPNRLGWLRQHPVCLGHPTPRGL